jgi:hypothetical protein
MRVSLLAAIVIGLLFMPLYAQTPEPQEVDTAQQAVEPEATEEAGEPEQATEPEAVEEAGEVEEVVEAAPVLSVQDMAFCTAVVEREPLSRDSSFSADIGQIFCWTNVLNAKVRSSMSGITTGRKRPAWNCPRIMPAIVSGAPRKFFPSGPVNGLSPSWPAPRKWER